MADVMKAAKEGHIIADTEEEVRDANAAFRQRVYEKAIRLLQDKQEAFSPRPKGPGIRWDKSNAEAMMALASLHHSSLWASCWKAERAAA